MPQEHLQCTDESKYCELPQDIIDACKIISDRAYNAADPTKISHISLPIKDIYNITKSPEEQMFVSLLSRPVFNVADVIREDWEFYSIWIDLNKVIWKLSIHEVIADILLQWVLFLKYADRCFIPGEDYHLGVSWSPIPFNTNNFKTSEQNYYIFDLEGEWLLEIFSNKEELLEVMLDEFLWMFWQDQCIIADQFLEKELTWKIFWVRILDRCKQLLEIYWFENGEKFFTLQVEKSKLDTNIDELYENFIKNVELISRIFEEDPEALDNYISHDKNRAKRELNALKERQVVLENLLNLNP